MPNTKEIEKFISIIKNMNEVQQMGVLMITEGMKAIKKEKPLSRCSRS